MSDNANYPYFDFKLEGFDGEETRNHTNGVSVKELSYDESENQFGFDARVLFNQELSCQMKFHIPLV